MELLRYIINNQDIIAIIIINLLNESFAIYGNKVSTLSFLLHIIILVIWKECSTAYDAEIFLNNVKNKLTPANFYASSPDDYGTIFKVISFKCDTTDIFIKPSHINQYKLHKNIYPFIVINVVSYFENISKYTINYANVNNNVMFIINGLNDYLYNNL